MGFRSLSIRAKCTLRLRSQFSITTPIHARRGCRCIFWHCYVVDSQRIEKKKCAARVYDPCRTCQRYVSKRFMTLTHATRASRYRRELYDWLCDSAFASFGTHDVDIFGALMRSKKLGFIGHATGAKDSVYRINYGHVSSRHRPSASKWKRSVLIAHSRATYTRARARRIFYLVNIFDCIFLCYFNLKF